MVVMHIINVKMEALDLGSPIIPKKMRAVRRPITFWCQSASDLIFYITGILTISVSYSTSLLLIRLCCFSDGLETLFSELQVDSQILIVSF